MQRAPLVCWLAALAGCTSLGPMPATTGTSPVPAPRPGAEVAASAVPGYFLSSSVAESGGGEPIRQLAALLDVGALVGLPGVIAGGRYVGAPEEGGHPEPMLGYRRFLDDGEAISAAAVAYATHTSGEGDGASYEASRGGLELSADLRLTPRSSWIELHLWAGGSLTAMSAEGSYCVDSSGRFASTCPEPPSPPEPMQDASASGVYPAVFFGWGVMTGRHLAGPFHGARVAMQIAGGTMPRVEAGEQQSAANYGALGLTLSLGLGAGE